jgi:hypothetical protein
MQAALRTVGWQQLAVASDAASLSSRAASRRQPAAVLLRQLLTLASMQQ